jgi:uncharacterized membrane protein YhiD involved in acid resistance
MGDPGPGPATAGIWMRAAIGVAVGLGSLGLALLSTFLTLIFSQCSEDSSLA